MLQTPARRRRALLPALAVALGLLAPTAASAAPTGVAGALGPRGSAFADPGGVRASALDEITVRDLSDACPTGRVPASDFRDVPRGSTFTRAIDCLVWYGITQGTSATSYGPNAPVTRQQMAVFLHRLLDDLGIALPDAPSRSSFRDVGTRGEAAVAINVLASDELAELLGVRVVTGRTSDTYDPAGRVSRAQMGSFINRTLLGVAAANGATIEQGACDVSRSDPDQGCFRDEASIPPTHRPNVAQLYRMGIVTGRTDGTYGPAADVTRGQMAAFLSRLLDVFTEARVSYPPDAEIELLVDADAEAGTCASATGSAARPFCTIQAAVDHGATKRGYAVDVVVLDAGIYEEDVRIDAGEAYELNLVGVPADGDDALPLNGTIVVEGDDPRNLTVVEAFDVLAFDGPAFDVRSAGLVALLGVVADGSTAVRVDQAGATLLFGATLYADVVGLDLVRTALAPVGEGTLVLASGFALGTDTYVRLPDASTTAADNAALWRADDAANGVFDPASSDAGLPLGSASQVVTVGGRLLIAPPA